MGAPYWAYGHAGHWFFGGPLMILLAIGLIVLGFWLIRGRDWPGHGHARNILDERYARGDMTTEEYTERSERLDSITERRYR